MYAAFFIHISPLVKLSSVHNISWSTKLIYNSRLKMHSGTSSYNQPVLTVADELKFVRNKPVAFYISAA